MKMMTIAAALCGLLVVGCEKQQAPAPEKPVAQDVKKAADAAKADVKKAADTAKADAKKAADAAKADAKKAADALKK